VKPSQNGNKVEVAAPAKVNLSLLVGPVRPDGFHEICSLLLPVTLSDLVLAERVSGGGLSVECEVSPGEKNLAAKIVRELERRLERTFDVRLVVRKQIPQCAGLGGGSSDAAAALIAVERLFALELAPRLRYDVATAVGADVPFFLWPGAQLAMGRGQLLKALTLPEPLHIVIAAPEVLRLSTAAVYAWRDEDARPSLKEFASRAGAATARYKAAATPDDVAALLENDLEASVVGRWPEVGALKTALLEAGALGAVMTGSGAAVIGLFAGEKDALEARARLAPARAWYVTDLQPLGGRAKPK
jgi:4-diphosphocytidyl-2-C-methyl-D-erythritol kinase